VAVAMGTPPAPFPAHRPAPPQLPRQDDADPVVDVPETNSAVLRSRVVGRRYHRLPPGSPRLSVGDLVRLDPEPTNRWDPHAVVVCRVNDAAPLGHLPAVVARAIGPVLNEFFKDTLVARGRVVDVNADAVDVAIDVHAVDVEEHLDGTPRLAAAGQTRASSPCPEVEARALGAWADAVNAATAATTADDRGGLAPGSNYAASARFVVETVLGHSGHVLSGPERAVLAGFLDAGEAAQSLYARLMQRKGVWFRTEGMSYAEVPAVTEAAEALHAVGLVDWEDAVWRGQELGFDVEDRDGSGTLDLALTVDEKTSSAVDAVDVLFERVQLLTVPVLKALAAKFGVGKASGSLDKDALVDKLRRHVRVQRDLLGNASGMAVRKEEEAERAACRDPLPLELSARRPWRPAYSGLCVTLSRLLREQLGGPRGAVGISRPSAELFRRCFLLFFLDASMDLSSFVLADLGQSVYPCSRLLLDRRNQDGPGRPQREEANPVFRSRSQLLQYEAACRLERATEAACEAVPVSADARDGGEDYAAAMEALDECVAIVEGVLGGATAQEDVRALAGWPPFHRRFSPLWRVAVAGGRAVAGLERAKRHGDAVRVLRLLLGLPLLCPSRRGGWWIRLLIDANHAGEDLGALQSLAREALEDPAVRGGDAVSLRHRHATLAWQQLGGAEANQAEQVPKRRRKRKGEEDPPSPKPKGNSRGKAPAQVLPAAVREVTIQGVPFRRGVGSKNLYFNHDDGAAVSVEELVLGHYADEAHGGWLGAHSEGGIWMALFALFMWDVVYDADVPGVFVHPFQVRPLDLGTDAFFETRRDAIEATLAELGRSSPREVAEKCMRQWDAHEGTLCIGLGRWDRWERREVAEIAAAAGGRCLSAIFRTLCEDFAHWHGGMPDLVLWKPEYGSDDAAVPHAGLVRLVEVKGPSDSLMDRQRAWLEILCAVADVEVCYVRHAVQQQVQSARPTPGPE